MVQVFFRKILENALSLLHAVRLYFIDLFITKAMDGRMGGHKIYLDLFELVLALYN